MKYSEAKINLLKVLICSFCKNIFVFRKAFILYYIGVKRFAINNRL